MKLKQFDSTQFLNVNEEIIFCTKMFKEAFSVENKKASFSKTSEKSIRFKKLKLNKNGEV